MHDRSEAQENKQAGNVMLLAEDHQLMPWLRVSVVGDGRGFFLRCWLDASTAQERRKQGKRRKARERRKRKKKRTKGI